MHRFYGPDNVNKAKAEIIKYIFKEYIDTPMEEDCCHPSEPIIAVDPTMGVPSAIALQMGDWVTARGCRRSAACG
jgi:4-cresol dehydrogenase (hydroxylating)